jgi:FkbM family methyltransferase
MCWRKIGEYTFVVHTFGEYKFICGNKTEYSRTVEYGGEKTPLGAFLFLLKAEDVVWDIGASVGLFTAHSAGIAKMVVAFEPDPATFGRLRQNVEINRLSDRTMTHQLALGSKKGQVILRTDGLDGNAPSVADLGRHSHSTMVQLETIDSLISQGLPVPSVMKIDIEGAELSALEGASKLLRSKQKPRLLFVEVHTKFLTNYHSRHDSVEKVLHQSGYNIIGTRKRDDQYHLIAYR